MRVCSEGRTEPANQWIAQSSSNEPSILSRCRSWHRVTPFLQTPQMLVLTMSACNRSHQSRHASHRRGCGGRTCGEAVRVGDAAAGEEYAAKDSAALLAAAPRALEDEGDDAQPLVARAARRKHASGTRPRRATPGCFRRSLPAAVADPRAELLARRHHLSDDAEAGALHNQHRPKQTDDDGLPVVAYKRAPGAKIAVDIALGLTERRRHCSGQRDGAINSRKHHRLTRLPPM